MIPRVVREASLPNASATPEDEVKMGGLGAVRGKEAKVGLLLT
jgi:hypothetical protein